MSGIGIVLPTQASLSGIQLGQGSWELESWLSLRLLGPGPGGQTVTVSHPSLSCVQLKSISCESEGAHECVCWLVVVVLGVVMKSLEPEPEGRALRQSWALLPHGHLSALLSLAGISATG